MLRGSATSVAGAGDVYGDGLDDVLVGAPPTESSSSRRGRAYVVFGRRRPRTIDLRALGRAGITLLGKPQTGIPDRFGVQVAQLGDINRDGLADVGILASGDYVETDVPPHDVSTPGGAYVVFGRRSGGSISMAHLGRAGFRIRFAQLMEGIKSAGDWNADGRPDILVTGQGRRRAMVWIVYGDRYTGTLRRPQRNRRAS